MCHDHRNSPGQQCAVEGVDGRRRGSSEWAARMSSDGSGQRIQARPLLVLMPSARSPNLIHESDDLCCDLIRDRPVKEVPSSVVRYQRTQTIIVGAASKCV